MKLLCAVTNDKVCQTYGRYCSVYEPSTNTGKRCCATCTNMRPYDDVNIILTRKVPPSLGENTGLFCKVNKRECKRGEGLRCRYFIASRAYFDHYCSNCEHSINHKTKNGV